MVLYNTAFNWINLLHLAIFASSMFKKTQTQNEWQDRVEVFTLGPQVFYTGEHGPSNYTSPLSLLPSIPPPPPPPPPRGLLALLL